MRLIGRLENEQDAQKFFLFLKRKGILTNCDSSFDANTGHMSYQIWAHDEDQIEEAEKEFAKFIQTPTHALYEAPFINQEATILEEEKISSRGIPTPFTTFVIALCALIFILNFFEEYSLFREGLSNKTFNMTKTQALLFFDLPPAIEQLEVLIEKHQIPLDQAAKSLSPEIQAEIEQLGKTPFWKGFYDLILLKIKGQDTSLAEGPLFRKILQGDVWRLFSPAILHIDFLHILFNMIWVWVLCRPIEQKIGILRLGALSLIVGIGSNTAQYLMGGPFFLGYSGVVMGLAGFTWMREKIAPWEGYPLARSTIVFLLMFVGGMFLVQATSFCLEVFTKVSFSPNIANTAHITGALIGAFLGRFSFFAERVRR